MVKSFGKPQIVIFYSKMNYQLIAILVLLFVLLMGLSWIIAVSGRETSRKLRAEYEQAKQHGIEAQTQAEWLLFKEEANKLLETKDFQFIFKPEVGILHGIYEARKNLFEPPPVSDVPGSTT